MAIVTNKPYGFIAPIFEALKMDGLFDLYVGGDSLSQKKPDPEPLLHACEKLDVTVEKALMVGDSKNDILAAKAANMQSVGVTYGYNYGEPIDLYKPEVVIDRFSDLKSLLKRV
jgi:phosphoglycolate phosphatase